MCMLKKFKELNERQKKWNYRQQEKFTKTQHIFFSLVGLITLIFVSLYMFSIPEEQADKLVAEYLLVSNPAVFILIFS